MQSASAVNNIYDMFSFVCLFGFFGRVGGGLILKMSKREVGIYLTA